MITVTRSDIKIEANAEKVIPLYLYIRNKNRIRRIVSDVLSMNEKVVEIILNQVLDEFGSRHIGFRKVLLRNYHSIEKYITSKKTLSLSRKLLLGSYFTKEYSVESAAVFNPSIVRHPDQNGLANGDFRFILSLRATGEGHISSIEFTSGIISKTGEITLDPMPSKLAGSYRSASLQFSKDFIVKRAKYYDDFNTSVFKYLPEQFSRNKAAQIISDAAESIKNNYTATKEALYDILDTNYDISFDKETALGNRVIFPQSAEESGGIEDARFVEFSDQDKTTYIGTYTAYYREEIKSKIIETGDFISFRIRSLYGRAVLGKGMALFPEKINGKYAMISRQGDENLSIMYSDDLYFWDAYKTIQKPEREWELIQLGNYGSPVKTPSGWLLLTHGVGPLRKYVISASLLDLYNPEVVLATLDKPFIYANADERKDYVPNAVYTCGIMQHFDNLIIPYAMSDSAVSFARVNIHLLIDELLSK
ncbi:MAG: hypothetical protein AMS26_02380 [Bacteroides sp. SM23_62]|nr:MAG: hypothetical protein AMS26_02380 [Bacteroides sp. SM23_62]